jgi:hypothetical protein
MCKRLFSYIFLALLWAPNCFAQYAWQDVDRVVAVGDVHGAYPQLVKLLKAAALVDADLRWSGGTTHLVSLGDLLDRGPQSRQAMDLLMRLQPEAQAAGGRVHVLMGNHELMNLSGDLRDVSEAEHAALADLGGHAAAFAQDGFYGSWLLGLPVMIRINGTLFTHGGLPPTLASMTLQEINELAQQHLRTLLSEGQRLREQELLAADANLMSVVYDADEETLAGLGEAFVTAANSPMFGGDGPLWYRGSAACHALLEHDPLTKTLTALNAQRVVVGHTPTPDREINTRLDGRVYVIDTGMLTQVYKGQPRLLEMRGEQIRGLNETGAEAAITQLPEPDPLAQLSEAQYQIQDTDQGVTTLTLADAHTGQFEGGTALPAVFRKLSKRNTNRAIAAYRIDRLLGLHMVPATAARKVGKQQGVVIAWDRRPFSEAMRMEWQLGRSNFCAQGSDSALLMMFDALIGKHTRTVDNLFYERGTMNIRITENFRAFGTSARLPQTAMQQTLPAALKTPLEQLSMESLTELLQDLLKPNEIKALLKRRDAILQWPVQP